ncbi:hypothetical protein VHEMI02088 [[Torrubiella] hemipterigena]|uniref:Cyclin-dependent kinase n=1 Tax=[Torrubiella] hemipterigena TaxID=1531966 RepID=A0A0A1T9E9_9HYPO|nr:hypothetical protein VHEMI02088 [[Torrubiella] hemipterigena]
MDRSSVSPLKRRAALASLDANAMPHSASSPTSTKHRTLSASSPTSKKRVSLGASPAPKKTCLADSTTASARSRTNSPDVSSVFDNASEGSGEDSSWGTVATEPADVGAAMPVTLSVPRASVLTREQARERAEILRLRLGLASYKLRTGQTSVPLANLQAKPLPPRGPGSVTSPLLSQGEDTSVVGSSQSDDHEQADDEDIVAATPSEPASSQANDSLPAIVKTKVACAV